MTAKESRAGSGDCERCRPGLISQPMNAASSLAYVAVGVATLRSYRPRDPIETVVGWSTIAAGIGSIAFHGPGGPASRLTHDAAVISLLSSIGLADISRRADLDVRWPVASIVPIVSVAVARSRLNGAAQAIAGAAAVIGEVARVRAKGRWATVGDRAIAPAAVVGATTHLLGRTGGPLCRPESMLQPHALWHVTTAATVRMRSRSITHDASGPASVHQ